MSRHPDYSFFSDNCAGVCPEVLAAVSRANAGTCPSYGKDCVTFQAEELINRVFDRDCKTFFVFNGTAANALAISTLCRSHQAIVCHPLAHIETDECAAPEHFSGGVKLVLADGAHGKITCQRLEQILKAASDVHRSKVTAISLTQATELGTVYSIEELKAIARVAKRFGVLIHIDGSRLANALAFLQITPREFVNAVQADVICLGGTKNGLLAGEAVIFFNKTVAEEFEFRRKQAGQLASKMRFLSCQWLAFLQDDLWLRNAEHANGMAHLLATRLHEATGVVTEYPRQSNAAFIRFPMKVLACLRSAGWRFSAWPNRTQRLVCSWASRQEQVVELISDCVDACTHYGGAVD